MVRRARWTAILVAVVTFAAAPRAALAHPLHTTLTELVEDRAHGAVRATIRVFADDFGTAVTRFTRGRVTPASGKAWEDASLAYELSAFLVADRAGHALALHSCGVRRSGDLLWICLEAAAPDVALLNVRNGFLCELFADQVNVVQATVNGARRTMLFTRGDKTKKVS